MNTNVIETRFQVTLYQLFVFLVCWLAGIFAGMDASLFTVVQPDAIAEVAQTAERTIISQLSSLVLFSFLIGWMMGGISAGIFGDKFGRTKAMVISILFYSIFTALLALTQKPWQLALFRFFTGLGVGGIMVSMSIMLAECWPNRSRALAVGALITSYQVGVFLSGLVSHLIPEWRTALVVGGIPAILSILILYCVEESEKWKTANLNKKEEQGQLSQVIHSDYLRQLLLGSAVFGCLLVGYWASLSWVPTWIQDLLGHQSSGHEKNLATMLHAIAAITGCFTAGYLADKWGRLPVIISSLTGAFLISAIMFLTNKTFSDAIYWQHSILGLFIGTAQAVMYLYLPELFPTHFRATAVGFCLNSGRILTAIAVLFVGMLVPLFGGYAMSLFVFSIVYLLGAAVAFAGKETKAQVLLD